MLTRTQRKDILKLLKMYRIVKAKQAKHYSVRAAHHMSVMVDSAKVYLKDIEDESYIIDKGDVKYYVLLASNFGGFNRENLLGLLQKQADFDVYYFIEQCNHGLLSCIFSPVKKKRKEISEKQADKICDKYRELCKKAAHGEGSYSIDKKIRQLRADVYGYARAIVNNAVTVKQEDLRAIYGLLSTVCYPYHEGDVADMAKKILKDKIAKEKEENKKNDSGKYVLADLDIEKHGIKFAKKPDSILLIKGAAGAIALIAVAGAIAVTVANAAIKKSDLKPENKEIKAKPVVDTTDNKDVSEPARVDTVMTPAMLVHQNRCMTL